MTCEVGVRHCREMVSVQDLEAGAWNSRRQRLGRAHQGVVVAGEHQCRHRDGREVGPLAAVGALARGQCPPVRPGAVGEGPKCTRDRLNDARRIVGLKGLGEGFAVLGRCSPAQFPPTPPRTSDLTRTSHVATLAETSDPIE